MTSRMGTEASPVESGKAEEVHNWDAVSSWDSSWDSENPSFQQEWSSTPPKSERKPLTREEELQFKAAADFKELLTRGREDESGDISSESEDFEEENEEENDAAAIDEDAAAIPLGEEADVQKFFEKLLEDEQELRKLYLENYKRGHFECAVCRATGGKVWKIYPNCAGLIQHSMTVLNTKRKAAHRGYGRAISSLLGWNSDKYLGISTKKKLQALSLEEGPEEGNSGEKAEEHANDVGGGEEKSA